MNFNIDTDTLVDHIYKLITQHSILPYINIQNIKELFIKVNDEFDNLINICNVSESKALMNVNLCDRQNVLTNINSFRNHLKDIKDDINYNKDTSDNSVNFIAKCVGWNVYVAQSKSRSKHELNKVLTDIFRSTFLRKWAIHNISTCGSKEKELTNIQIGEIFGRMYGQVNVYNYFSGYYGKYNYYRNIDLCKTFHPNVISLIYESNINIINIFNEFIENIALWYDIHVRDSGTKQRMYCPTASVKLMLELNRECGSMMLFIMWLMPRYREIFIQRWYLSNLVLNKKYEPLKVFVEQDVIPNHSNGKGNNKKIIQQTTKIFK